MKIFKESRPGMQFLYVHIVSIMLLCVVCCKDANQQSSHKTKNRKHDTNAETFQELGFFGPVKQDKWDNFVQAVQNNIAHSRKEPGNLAFRVYQPEDGRLEPLWFERFKTKGAHNLHKQQGYFKNAITVIQQSLAGEANSIELKELKEIPAIIPKHSNDPKMTYTIITLFDVQPENRQHFVTGITDAAFKCRALAGNLEYNLYRYKDEPKKFVVIEGWKNKTNYDARVKQQIKQPDSKWFAAYPVIMIVSDLSR